MKRDAITEHLRRRVSGLMAIYAFGSRLQGTANKDSDLDLAVLVQGYADPLLLWDLSSELADIAGCSVDLLDFRAASTVMQYQVLTSGERWWQASEEVGCYEAAILSEKLELDRARAGLMADISRRGSVHGR